LSQQCELLASANHHSISKSRTWDLSATGSLIISAGDFYNYQQQNSNFI
jgi:hypothetical protein